MKCECCGEDGKGMAAVKLGCGHRQMWCRACREAYGPVVIARSECMSCEDARRARGELRWYEREATS